MNLAQFSYNEMKNHKRWNDAKLVGLSVHRHRHLCFILYVRTKWTFLSVLMMFSSICQTDTYLMACVFFITLQKSTHILNETKTQKILRTDSQPLFIRFRKTKREISTLAIDPTLAASSVLVLETKPTKWREKSYNQNECWTWFSMSQCWKIIIELSLITAWSSFWPRQITCDFIRYMHIKGNKKKCECDRLTENHVIVFISWNWHSVNSIRRLFHYFQ